MKASPVASALLAVWGSSGSDVFAAGSNTTLLHFNGTSWSVVFSGGTPPIDLTGIWGTSGSDVFLVGEFGVIVHYDGTTWTQLASPTANNLFGVWGSGGTQVIVVGDGGTVLRGSR